MLEIRTANATLDEISDEDYRAMFEEISQGRGMREVQRYILARAGDKLTDPVSHAAWDKYRKEPKSLTRRMKNELRLANGLDELPLTIEEAMEDVSADATVGVLEGTTGVLDQVVLGRSDDPRWQVLVGRNLEAGDGIIVRDEGAEERRHRVRKKVVRPYVQYETDERREKLGVSWSDVIEAGLEILAARKLGDGAYPAERDQAEAQQEQD